MKLRPWAALASAPTALLATSMATAVHDETRCGTDRRRVPAQSDSSLSGLRHRRILPLRLEQRVAAFAVRQRAGMHEPRHDAAVRTA